MAGEEGVPPWVTFILEQVQQQFADMNRRLDTLVSRDAFTQEQNRVNEALQQMRASQDDLRRELEALKSALQSEATARVTAETNLAHARTTEQKDRDKEQAARRWQIFGILASPFASALVIWVLSGGLRVGGS